MKLLIDIGHPGHVHYFKNTIKIMKEHGHEICVTARDKKIITILLQKFNIPFINRGKGKNSRIGKLIYMFQADFKLLKISLKFKPDLFLSFTTAYAPQVAFLLNKPSIIMNDTEHADKLNSFFIYPFTSVILTPSSYLNDIGKKQIRFNSLVEYIYLHKNYYKPNPQIKSELLLEEKIEYIILRFVSWNAHHDFGQSGLDVETKRELISLLKTKYKILISSEEELPEEFKPYQIIISPEKMHDALAYASIFIGESATMASESVLLGTPAVYINSLPIMCNMKVEQDAGLLKHFQSSKGVVDYVSNLMNKTDLKPSTISRSAIMKNDFIDTTAFLVWFIENYPESVKSMRDNPDVQLKFK